MTAAWGRIRTLTRSLGRTQRVGLDVSGPDRVQSDPTSADSSTAVLSLVVPGTVMHAQDAGRIDANHVRPGRAACISKLGLESADSARRGLGGVALAWHA